MRRTRIPQRTGRRRPAREHRGAAGARGRRSPRSQAGRPPSHGTEASEFCTDRAGPEDGKAGGGLGLVPPSADGGPRIRRTSLVATPEGAHPLPLLTAGAAEARAPGPRGLTADLAELRAPGPHAAVRGDRVRAPTGDGAGAGVSSWKRKGGSVKGGPETRVQPRPRTRRVRAPGPTSRLRPSSCSTFVSRAHTARPAHSRPLPRRGSRRLASPPAVGGPGPPCGPVGPAPGSPPRRVACVCQHEAAIATHPQMRNGGTNFLSPRSPPEGARGELQERTDSNRAVGSAGLREERERGKDANRTLRFLRGGADPDDGA